MDRYPNENECRCEYQHFRPVAVFLDMNEIDIFSLRVALASLLIGFASAAPADADTYRFEEMQAANAGGEVNRLSLIVEGISEHFEEGRWSALYAGSADEIRSTPPTPKEIQR